ncbi:MAG: divergent polysaccharide deacetylase family protein, partial [Magnetococcales bacterium]|nr:divergent polysaccharide deacetylase family protein [Magnetococcales bacterium]
MTAPVPPDQKPEPEASATPEAMTDEERSAPSIEESLSDHGDGISIAEEGDATGTLTDSVGSDREGVSQAFPGELPDEASALDAFLWRDRDGPPDIDGFLPPDLEEASDLEGFPMPDSERAPDLEGFLLPEAEDAPETAECLMPKAEDSSEASGVAPETTEGVSEAFGVAPEQAEVASEAFDVAPETTEGASEASGVAPETTEGASEASGVAPETTEGVSEASGVALEKAEVASEASGVSLEKTEAAFSPPPAADKVLTYKKGAEAVGLEPESALENDIELEEDLEGDPPSREWWILPLVAAMVVFLAGMGAGRYMEWSGSPWSKVMEVVQSANTTLLSMAGSVPASPESQSGDAATPTVTDAGTALPVKSNPSATAPENGSKESAAAEGSAPSSPEKGSTAAEGSAAASGEKTAAPAGTAPQSAETGPLPDEVTAQPQPSGEEATEIDLQYEESLPHEPVALPSAPAGSARREGTRVAIVIDDLGYNVPVSLAIARLPYAVTLAILPGGDAARQVAVIGKESHKEVILHQPMEPLGYPRTKPGPGALLMGMGADEIRSVLVRNLEKFPEAIGINNHMGSRITQYRPAMDAVMEILKERGLFFLDSRTSQTSVGYARAKVAGIPAARRDVFLDNVPKVSAIEARLAELEHVARVTGRAIGIGHPYRETLTALQHWLPAATKRGIQVEGISRFLDRGTPEVRRDPVPDKSAETGKPVKLKSDTSLIKSLPGTAPVAVDWSPTATPDSVARSLSAIPSAKAPIPSVPFAAPPAGILTAPTAAAPPPNAMVPGAPLRAPAPSPLNPVPVPFAPAAVAPAAPAAVAPAAPAALAPAASAAAPAP